MKLSHHYHTRFQTDVQVYKTFILSGHILGKNCTMDVDKTPNDCYAYHNKRPVMHTIAEGEEQDKYLVVSNREPRVGATR